ncbi:hypothetical protein MIDIC_160015 [Alphaproteobacteria bacterium]
MLQSMLPERDYLGDGRSAVHGRRWAVVLDRGYVDAFLG